MNFIKLIFSQYILISVLVLGFSLRLISLNQSLWLDEATSGYIARDYTIKTIVNDFTPGDFHPPLYYAVLQIWSQLFGSEEIALRLPSVIFGLLTVMVVFMLMGEMSTGIFPKFAASVLLATSGLHIYYSQEARMYALSAFLVSALVYAFVKTLKNNSRLFFTFFAILLVLNFLTDYLPNLILLVFWLYGLITVKDKHWWLRFILAHLPLVIVFLIWLPYLQIQLQTGLAVKELLPGWWQVIGKASFKELLLVPVKFILGRINLSNKILYAGIILSLGITYGGALGGSLRKLSRINGLIWLWLVTPLVLAFLASFKIPVFSYFRLLFVLPAFYILIALGLAKLKNPLKTFLFLIFFWVNIITSAVYLLNPRYHREDWRGAFSYIQNGFDSQSVILFPSLTGTEALRFYAPDLNYSVNNLPSGYNKLWLMRYGQPIFDSGDTVRKQVEAAGYRKTEEQDFNGVVIWKYIYENRH